MNAYVLQWLGWLCYLAAALAILAYVIHVVRRPSWQRPWNAAGLFFTGLALTQLPSFMIDGGDGPAFLNAVLAVVSLMLPATLQGDVALRTRRRADDRAGDGAPGQDRRSGDRRTGERRAGDRRSEPRS